MMGTVIHAMQQSFEQNKALLKIRKQKAEKFKHKELVHSPNKKLVFKQVSDRDLEKVKAHIRRDAKLSGIRQLLFFCFLAVIVTMFFIYILI